MTKKRMGVLLILLLVMIISVGAISAADTNNTLLGEGSDTNIATTSVAIEGNNATSPGSEAGDDVVEISANDDSDGVSDEKLGGSASSNVGEEVLSASNDDLLRSNGNNFLYNGKWYEDLDDAFDDADDDPGNKIIYVWRGTYKYTDDSDEFSITIDDPVSITLQPYDSTHEVIFDAEDKDYFFTVQGNNVHLTINDITFKNGNAYDGGAIEVENGGQVTLNRCTFESNNAYDNIAGGFGLGGAIVVDEGSLEANDC